MGHDQVTEPPDNALSHRSYTNISQLQNNTWRLLSRPAHGIKRTVPRASATLPVSPPDTTTP
jgi:hypothetical protein